MKNIILLSDGTGNCAAKKNRTNVWRLYRALDLHRDDQVAFYDDGVGSQEFLPFKILGGALSWGMKRNVLELYKFLCRNYELGNGNDDADKIYLFGFSRGAFTVRVLAGLIDYCGLCTPDVDEEDLHKMATNNYSAYRSKFKHGYLSRAFRTLFRLSSTPQYSVKPGIEFIGVWDTVDAYGLPIDELAILWDRLIFPIRFSDRQLSTKVKKACHAVSVDDERHTFHPVLWDERREQDPAQGEAVQAGRIEQVWFAGVHSDVGGGYPMNDLSLIPLDWMISNVEATAPAGPGLHFIGSIRWEFYRHSDWHGMQHDSRSGLAAYYRYKPREIDRLCNDSDGGVIVSNPKIHRGVLERIKGDAVPYAPTGLPASYEVVSTRGIAPVFETPPQAGARVQAMSHALDVIYWRRWLYAALLATTAMLVASPFLLSWDKDGICVGQACVLDAVLEFGIDALPDFASHWFEALRQNPGWLWGFVATYVILLLSKNVAWKATRSHAMTAWAELKGKGAPPGWMWKLTPDLRRAAQSELRTAIKWTLAGAAFVLILVLLGVLTGRTAFHVRSTLGTLCQSTNSTPLEESQSITLDISNPCFATGIALEKGRTYGFEVVAGPWFDGPIPTTPDGFDSSENPMHGPWVPLRRRVSEPWFKLIGRIDDAGNEDFPIGSGPAVHKARSNGELFLYVNDVVFGLLPGPYWAWPYFWAIGANRGTATITITPLAGNKWHGRGLGRGLRPVEKGDAVSPD